MRNANQAAFFLASASTSTPIMSLSFIMRYSTPSILTSVPDHLPNRMRSPTLTSIGMSLPLSSRPAGPTAVTFPCCGFSWAVSGMIMPPTVFASASIRSSITSRSRINLICADLASRHAYRQDRPSPHREFKDHPMKS